MRRIEECAAKLGYRPLHAARSLRMGKTMQIGVVVADIANPFFGEIAAQIKRYARLRGDRTCLVGLKRRLHGPKRQVRQQIFEHRVFAFVCQSAVGQRGAHSPYAWQAAL